MGLSPIFSILVFRAFFFVPSLPAPNPLLQTVKPLPVDCSSPGLLSSEMLQRLEKTLRCALCSRFSSVSVGADDVTAAAAAATIPTPAETEAFQTAEPLWSCSPGDQRHISRSPRCVWVHIFINNYILWSQKTNINVQTAWPYKIYQGNCVGLSTI